MAEDGRPITRSIELKDVSTGKTLRSHWQWNDRDPYVVKVEFICSCSSSSCNSVTWEFDRQIVIDGIATQAGLWDVKMRRTGKKTVELVLDSPDGRGVFECPRPELRAFVRELVPQIPEPRLPSDDEVALFLASAAYLKDKRFGPWPP